MAQIYSFQPLRYTAAAGSLECLVTQPYDKISAPMQARYLAASPYNLVRIILGERRPGDSDADNVYTRAARYLNDWTAAGILARDPEPGIFPYFQEFTVPDTGEQLVRKGFIALGAVEDYSAGVVHRHEQTLAGPKKDRLDLLRHTHAHFGQIFMLYPDPAGAVDALLDAAAEAAPLAEVADEYGAVHRVWKIAGGERIRALMADKKLLIADGHHRYETALAFHQENPDLPGAGPRHDDLRQHALARPAHPGHPPAGQRRGCRRLSAARRCRFRSLRNRFSGTARARLGRSRRAHRHRRRHRAAAFTCSNSAPPPANWTSACSTTACSAKALGITEEAVRDERHLRYIRGLDAAVEEARRGAAQIAFLLKPTSIAQVAETSFGGGVMPQKSTDFYPKLLSGLTIYQLG